MFEIYYNVTGLEIYILDEEGNSLLKAGDVRRSFTELVPSDWPANWQWMQLVKDGKVQLMKLEPGLMLER